MKNMLQIIEANVVIILFITTILSGSNIALAAHTTSSTLISPKLTIAPSASWEILLTENFTDGNIPPQGTQGTWQLNQTNSEETWHIDTLNTYSVPYCATIERNQTITLQDEWLITPSLDFSSYTSMDELQLRFRWNTESYLARELDIIDLNISISTDGGTTWAKIWSDDDITHYYEPWKWQYSNDDNPIDLAGYAGESDVIIGIHYYSNSTIQAEFQRCSIDDIEVRVRAQDVECYDGGPYEWWWHKQYFYDLVKGVRFHGDIYGVPKTECVPRWDFGDGNSSIGWNPINLYKNVGDFSINFTVTHLPTGRVFTNETNITLFLLPPSELSIEVQPFSLGIKSIVENTAQYNATYINCTIHVYWGPLQIFEILVANDTIERLLPQTRSDPLLSGYFTAFGGIHIVVSANPENLPGKVKHFFAFKIGPLILGAHET